MMFFGCSVNSSPRFAPCNGTSQPSSSTGPGPPLESSTNACVFSFCSFAGACAACTAICWQYGHASHVLSSCCSHCEQNFFLKIQNPLVRIGGFGLGPPPGICGAPIGPAGNPGAGGKPPGAPGGIPGAPGIPGCCICWAPC